MCYLQIAVAFYFAEKYNIGGTNSMKGKFLASLTLSIGLLAQPVIPAFAENITSNLEFVQKKDLSESITEATLLTGEEKHSYQFELTDTKKVSIELRPKESKVLIFYLKDQKGNNILSMNNDVGREALLDEVGLPAGKYSIEVIRRYSHQNDIPYTLNLTTTTNPYYEVEDNGSFKTANLVNVNRRYEGNAHKINTVWDRFKDEDYYKFNVVYGGMYKLLFKGEGASFAFVYNADEEAVTGWKDSKVYLKPGTYYLYTYNTSTQFTNQPYWFEIQYLDTPSRVMWGKTELVKGQLGKVTVQKSTTLWKRHSDGTLEKARTLQAGEEYRVYRYLNEKSGLYGVGGGLFIEKNPSQVLYETPSKKNLNLVKLINGEL